VTGKAQLVHSCDLVGDLLNRFAGLVAGLDGGTAPYTVHARTRSSGTGVYGTVRGDGSVHAVHLYTGAEEGSARGRRGLQEGAKDIAIALNVMEIAVLLCYGCQRCGTTCSNVARLPVRSSVKPLRILLAFGSNFLGLFGVVQTFIRGLGL